MGMSSLLPQCGSGEEGRRDRTHAVRLGDPQTLETFPISASASSVPCRVQLLRGHRGSGLMPSGMHGECFAH